MTHLGRKRRGFLAVLVILSLFLLGGTASAVSRKNLQAKILAFNDFHGQLSPKTLSGRPVGGAAVLASYLKRAKAGMEGQTIIVSAGGC